MVKTVCSMERKSFFDGLVDVHKDSTKQNCFEHFDRDGKGHLDKEDFSRLLDSLFKMEVSDRIDARCKELYLKFDAEKKGEINKDGFDCLWSKWAKPLLKPVTALLIIDVQNDFIDGSMALKSCPAKQKGADVIPVINELLDSVEFDVVVYSLDWHPSDHISFFSNLNQYKVIKDTETLQGVSLYDTVTFEGPPKMQQTLWPVHCVQETWGAELHSKLKISNDPIYIHKGTNNRSDSYSAFWDNLKLSQTPLDMELKSRGVSHVFICGLAYDYCVGFTALDARQLGYATVVVHDATRSVDLTNANAMEKKLKENDCVLVESSQIANLANGQYIAPEFIFYDNASKQKDT